MSKPWDRIREPAPPAPPRPISTGIWHLGIGLEVTVKDMNYSGNKCYKAAGAHLAVGKLDAPLLYFYPEEMRSLAEFLNELATQLERGRG